MQNLPRRENAAVTIEPLKRATDFHIEIPPSKSLANRALILAGMASGISAVHGIPPGKDSQAALAVLTKLGARLEPLAASTDQPESIAGVRIHGLGHCPNPNPGDLHIQSAGTVGRFLPGLLASAENGAWTLTSSEQLAGRPILPLVSALRTWGADITLPPGGASFPMHISGKKLAGGPVTISAAASSQFASGLLLAAPYCQNDAVIRITDLDPDERYIDSTLDVMRHFGAAFTVTRETAQNNSAASTLVVTVEAGRLYHAADYQVEADLNAALVFLLIPLLVGGRATVTNIPSHTQQPGSQLLEVIKRLGGEIISEDNRLTVAASGKTLHGGFSLDMRAMAEMALAMAVVSAFADHPITLTNLAHIRNHETDRLAAIAHTLALVNVHTESGNDWLRIYPQARATISRATVDSHDDHRLAMAMSLLGLAANGITITNPQAVAKTFPDFFTRLASI